MDFNSCRHSILKNRTHLTIDNFSNELEYYQFLIRWFDKVPITDELSFENCYKKIVKQIKYHIVDNKLIVLLAHRAAFNYQASILITDSINLRNDLRNHLSTKREYIIFIISNKFDHSNAKFIH